MAAKVLPVAALAGALLMAPSTAQASLMAYEGFNYSASSGNLPGLSGGFGWMGGWRTVNNGASTIQGSSLAAGANAPAGYDAASVGNSVTTPNGSRSGRYLDTSAGGSFGVKGFINANGYIGASGKTVYISFLQQPNGTTSYYEFEFHRGDLGDPGRVGGVGNDSGGNTSVYLRVPSAGQTAIGAGSAAVNFYVVRIDFLGGNDTVYVYQNPTSATEPGMPTLLKTGAGDMAFNGLSFGCWNNGRTVAHDEIRVGETWADVVNGGTFSTGAWDGGGADNNWSTAANWDNDVLPIFASSLKFAGSTRLNSTNDLPGVSANNITFDAAAGAFTLAGNSLGVNGTIGFTGVPAAPITQTLNLPLTPSGNFAVDTRTNGNITLKGDVTGPSSTLTQTSSGNAGVLTLAGANSLAGFIINGGTNRITGSTAVNLNTGTRFCLANGNSSYNATVIIENGASLTVSGDSVDAGVLGRDSGVGSVIQNGGTFSFNIPNHPYLFVGAGNNARTYGSYTLNAGVLDLNANSLGIGLGASGASVTGVVAQVGGVVTNVGQLILGYNTGQVGRGIYKLTGGSISIGSQGIQSQTGVYEIYLGGGTVGAQASWSSPLNMTLTGSNGPVTFNPAGNTITLSGILSGPGGLKVSGGGILELSGANTYTGDTVVDAGSTLQWDVTGSSAGALRVANGGMLNLFYSGTYAVGSFYTNGVRLPIGTYNANNLPGFITGSGDLQVTSGISTGLWTGGGADNNWSTAGNWDNNAVPVFPHSVTFAGSSRLANNNDLNALTLSSVTFDAAAGAFTLGGNDATLGGSIGFNGTPAAPVTQTVNFGLTFTGNQTIDLPANGTLNLGGSVNSGYNLVKAGAGTLTLGGSYDYFSGLRVIGGTNVITGNVYISGTSDNNLFFIGDIGTVGTLVIQPGASLNVSGFLGDSGVLGRDSGSGTIIQNGGTFSFNPANPNRGYLFVGASSSAATRAEYDMNGGTFDMNNWTLGVALSANASTLITGVVNQVNGSINNVGKLLLGTFTFGPGRGIYRLSGGSIALGQGGIQSDSGIYEVYLGGGTVGAYASWSSPLNMRLTGSNGPVTFDTASNTIKLTGILSGPGGFNLAGGGILELAGANTFAGDMTVTAGTLQLDTIGSSAGALRLVDGTYLNLNFSGDYVVAGFYTNGVRVPFGTYNAGNLPGFISGAGNLVVRGVSTGLWTGSGTDNNWSTANNWDGNAVPIFPLGLTFGGNTRLNNNNDLVGVTATSITFSNTAGAFTLNGNGLGLTGDINFTGNPAAPVTHTVNLPLTVNANVALQIPANGNLLVNGDITATNNAAYKVDSGTVTLNGNDALAGFEANGGNTVITGNVTLSGTGNSRAYIANGDYASGCVGAMTIENGATFTVTGNFADAYVVGRDGGAGTLTQNGGLFNYAISNNHTLFVSAGNSPQTQGTYNLNGGVLEMNDNTLAIGLAVQGASVTGMVNQAGGIITNANRLVLGWNNNQPGRGIYKLTGGSLYLGANGIQTQTGIYELYLGGGTMGAVADWSSVLDMTLTGINGPVTFDTAGNTISLSGVLSGVGGLTVSGGGVLALSGANTYTGPTVVNQGTLKLQSPVSSTSAIKVADGATLNLSYNGTLVVASFSTNNVALPGGTYNAANLPGFLTGAGSLQVVRPVPTAPTNITCRVSGGQMSLSWPADYQGWTLQRQTNALSVGLSGNWVDVEGTANVTSTNLPIDPAAPTVFYRLRYLKP